MFRILAVIAGIFALGGVLYVVRFPDMSKELGEVQIGSGKVFKVEIADSPEERALGLGKRDRIGSDGMLFIFETPARYGFWMKNVKFPLDFVWVMDDRIVGLERDVPVSADPDPPQYYPPSDVNFVLELPAGTIQKYRLDLGAKVRIQLPN